MGCAVIGALGLGWVSARADVIVSCEVRLDVQARQLVGVEDRVFDLKILYVSPSQIKPINRLLIDGPAMGQDFGGFIISDDFAIVSWAPRNQTLESDRVHLEWHEMVVENDDAFPDAPALIQWDDDDQTDSPETDPLEHLPSERFELRSPVTLLGTGPGS